MSKFFSALLALALLFGAGQAQANYIIAPGDVLQVEVLEDPELNRNVLVLPDGSVTFPGAGTFRAGGNPVEAVRRVLTSRLSSEFASEPTVYVSVAQVGLPGEETGLDMAKLYVMGEINGPGVLETDEEITLLQAIAQAGGFTRFAAKKRVELHRMDPSSQTEQVYVFDYVDGTGISGATRLMEGDVIVVPERRLFE